MASLRQTYSSVLPEKKLDSKEERRRADPAYEVMESRMPEKHPEVRRHNAVIRFTQSAFYTHVTLFKPENWTSC